VRDPESRRRTAASWRTTVVEIAFMSLESIVAFGSTTSVTARILRFPSVGQR